MFSKIAAFFANLFTPKPKAYPQPGQVVPIPTSVIGKITQMKLSYKVAQTQKGVAEISGPKDNGKIIEYHDSCTLHATDDETAWCSAFANWCYMIAGILMNPASMQYLLKSYGYTDHQIKMFFASAAQVNAVLKYQEPHILAEVLNTGLKVKCGTRSAAARSWATFGTKTKNPKEGDMAVLARGNDGWSGHICYFVKPGVLFFDALGGNQSNQVCIANEPNAKVLAFITEDEV